MEEKEEEVKQEYKREDEQSREHSVKKRKGEYDENQKLMETR